MFAIFDLAFSKIVDPTIFVRDLFLFGALRARFFLCTGIFVARRHQSTKSQVTAVSVNRGLPVRQSTKSQFARVPSRASSPRSRRSQSPRCARPSRSVAAFSPSFRTKPSRSSASPHRCLLQAGKICSNLLFGPYLGTRCLSDGFQIAKHRF